MTDPMALAGLVANRAIFGAQPYGHVLEGTPASLAALKRGDITAAYTKGWQPADVTLVMVGDVTPAAAKPLAEQQLGAWKAAPAAPTAAAPPVAAPAPRVVLVDHPAAGQPGTGAGHSGRPAGGVRVGKHRA